jgi:hypothetical protein
MLFASNIIPVESGTFYPVPLFPVADAASGQGMYGQSDVNLSIYRMSGHNQSTNDTVQGNPALAPGHEVPSGNWGYFGNETFQLRIEAQMSITKAFSLRSVQLSMVPQAIEECIRQLNLSVLDTYSRYLMYKFVEVGRCANDEFVDGNVNRPVCKYVQYPEFGVNEFFDQVVNTTGAVPIDASGFVQNAFVKSYFNYEQ